MPSAQRPFVLDPKYRWIGLVVVAVIGVALLIAWPYLRPAPTPEGRATEACQSAVLAQSPNPGTATFDAVRTSNLTQSLLFLGLEEVTDMAVNGFVIHDTGNRDVTQRFVCRVHLDHTNVTVTDLSVD